jgi:hypothetical protein
MQKRCLVFLSLILFGCSSNPYSWENEHYYHEFIQACKKNNPESVNCNIFAREFMQNLMEDGTLYHTLDKVTNSCIETHVDHEEERNTCITNKRSDVWQSIIRSIQKNKNNSKLPSAR